MSGLFIVLEGIDGAGTTTQGHRLVERLHAAGRKARFTCEPSIGPIGTRIREFLRDGASGRPLDAGALALLFAADRLDHLAREVEPAIATGDVVVCDRYVLSSLAYQGAFLDLEWVAQINGRARTPDLTVFVDVGVQLAAARRAGRGASQDQFEVDEVQRKVAENYRALSSRPSLGPMALVDGEGSIDDVQARIWEAVEKLAEPAGTALA